MKKLFWRKKLLAFAATAALGAVLTGCGSQSATTASSVNAGNVGSNTSVADINTDSQTQVRVIKGVTGGSLAPYMYIDENNELTGVDIEIAKEVFNRIPEYDLEIEVADALQGVLSGQYDIAINNYGYTETRAESYYFSYPYKTTFNVYIQRPDDTPLTSLQDIADRGYKIELNAGGLTANALEQWNADNPEHQINIVYSETNFQVKFEHLIDKTTDVAIDDGPIMDTLLEKFGLEGQLVGNEIDPETEDFLFPQNNTYFLFGKNDDGYEIREKVDVVLKEMKEDGTLAEITSKYFNKDTSPKAEYFESTRN
ncbi:MAG: transporter substrate-binding domain-containing protein [Lachnospiraceae bacterium]|nr:transporter substrate-binding domain-containing protein [Lachnospiraceae bacterium]